MTENNARGFAPERPREHFADYDRRVLRHDAPQDPAVVDRQRASRAETVESMRQTVFDHWVGDDEIRGYQRPDLTTVAALIESLRPADTHKRRYLEELRACVVKEGGLHRWPEYVGGDITEEEL
jgi:hypothetical protein